MLYFPLLKAIFVLRSLVYHVWLAWESMTHLPWVTFLSFSYISIVALSTFLPVIPLLCVDSLASHVSTSRPGLLCRNGRCFLSALLFLAWTELAYPSLRGFPVLACPTITCRANSQTRQRAGQPVNKTGRTGHLGRQTDRQPGMQGRKEGKAETGAKSGPGRAGITKKTERVGRQ